MIDAAMSSNAPTLHDSVRAAADRPEVLAAVARVYEDVRAEIERRQPVCQLSGRCCKFEEFGHRLYVSTLELAAFTAGLKAEGGRMKDEREAAGERITPLSSFRLQVSTLTPGCPFQVGKLCGVHTIRPFGCRMYFCDTTAADWQQETYEMFHRKLKLLHDELGIPYFYVEWRAALGELFAIGVEK